MPAGGPHPPPTLAPTLPPLSTTPLHPTLTPTPHLTRTLGLNARTRASSVALETVRAVFPQAQLG